MAIKSDYPQQCPTTASCISEDGAGCSFYCPDGDWSTRRRGHLVAKIGWSTCRKTRRQMHEMTFMHMMVYDNNTFITSPRKSI